MASGRAPLFPLAPSLMTQITALDYVVMAIYFAVVLGIGWALRRKMRTSNDFLLSGRSLPPWVTGLAFLSANLGAQEVIGMGASGAKYGISTSHFYWIGAIPAMVFVGIYAIIGGRLIYLGMTPEPQNLRRVAAEASSRAAFRTRLSASTPASCPPMGARL